MFGLLIAQALFLCALGGGLGMLVAWSVQGLIATWLGTMFPGFVITPGTFALATGVTLLLGILAGMMPAWQAGRLRCVQALRGE
jgi:putative ABC transport system permease protein